MAPPGKTARELNRSNDIVIAGRQEITKKTWPTIGDTFERYISMLVVQEASKGDRSASELRLKAIGGIPVLGIDDKAESSAVARIKDNAVPKRFPEDALHIALAATKRITAFQA